MGDQGRRFIPIDQVESAYQVEPDTLLAQDVYKNLLDFVGEACERARRAKAKDLKLDQSRSHCAVLLDGKRGTGKSSVLVNLPGYLSSNSQDAKWIDRVHVLKPVDPTLLEDHNDLFLNVIVAAVLSDDKIRKAQESSESDRKRLALQLQKLGHALEKMQSQDDTKGLEKLRAFMGNHQLVEEVHNFFRLALDLIDKDLLVLTIDDVDTSLSKAFENLEIVRRYLTTPTVMPIISGDRDLYNELTWRDFHGRILEDSSYQRGDAHKRALELAIEYQRKVLPLHYRLRMPDVSSYLSDPNIFLRGAERGGKELQLRTLHEWLETFLMGPVNGLENSSLGVPLDSIRALVQLVQSCKKLIPRLPSIFFGTLEVGDVAHACQMPSVPRDVLRSFESSYASVKRKDKDAHSLAYYDFSRKLESVPLENKNVPELLTAAEENEWSMVLEDYLSYEPRAGGAYLVLHARRHWYDNQGGKSQVFDTPLFQPHLHNDRGLPFFEKTSVLKAWRPTLEGKLPQEWIERLPPASILPYPIPEVGGYLRKNVSSSTGQMYRDFSLGLMLHRNYYSSSDRERMVGIGRIVELVVTSLVRDIDLNELLGLLSRAPFYSTAAFAATKTHRIERDEFDKGQNGYERFEKYDRAEEGNDFEGDETQLARFAADVNTWRKRHGLSTRRISPWLIYNVFNKVMNQSVYFNQANKALGSREVMGIALTAFNSLWAAFGSFEKGPLFGLPSLIATVNPSANQSFENSSLFINNILPFFPRRKFFANDEESAESRSVVKSVEARKRYGRETRSITYCLGEHPLRSWLNNGLESRVVTVSEWLGDRLDIDDISVTEIRRGIRAKFPDRESVLDFKEEFYSAFEVVPDLYKTQVNAAVEKVLALKMYQE